MEIAVNPKDRRYLAQKVRTGKFKSASDVVGYALERLRADERDVRSLKRDLDKAAESLARGEGIDWDVEAQKARFLRRMQRNRGKP